MLKVEVTGSQSAKRRSSGRLKVCTILSAQPLLCSLLLALLALLTYSLLAVLLQAMYRIMTTPKSGRMSTSRNFSSVWQLLHHSRSTPAFFHSYSSGISRSVTASILTDRTHGLSARGVCRPGVQSFAVFWSSAFWSTSDSPLVPLCSIRSLFLLRERLVNWVGRLHSSVTTCSTVGPIRNRIPYSEW